MGVTKRPLCRIAAGFVTGILLGVYGNVWCLAAAVVLAAGCAFCCRTGPRGLFYAAVVLLEITVAVCLGAWRYEGARETRERCLSGLSDGMEVTVQGKLVWKEYKNDQYLYYLKSCYVKAKDMTGMSGQGAALIRLVPCSQIVVYTGTDDCQLGKTLVLNGTVELWKKASNEGNFDAQKIYAAKGIDFKVTNCRILSEHGTADSRAENLYWLRNQIAQVYAQYLPQEEAGVLDAMVLGDKTLLDKETKQLYQKTGISHILAISGLHISVIGMTIYRVLRKLGTGFGGAGIAAGVFMAYYAAMIGMGTSVSRAVIMFFLMLAGGAAGRSYDSLSALAAATLVLLWDYPETLFSAGFLLSFGAVIGVVYLGGICEKMNPSGFIQKFLRNFIMRKEPRVTCEKMNAKKPTHLCDWRAAVQRILGTLAVSAAIQLATVPLVAWYFYEQPLYGIFANLVVLPLMAVLLYLGIAGGIAGMVLPFAAKFFLFPCHLILSWYETVCVGLNSLPGAVFICGQPPLWKMAVYYLLLAALAAGIYARQRKEKEKTKRGSVGLLAGGALLLVFLLCGRTTGFEVDVLDVGQGDGIFIQAQNGETIFVDGGSSNVSRVGTYRILPFLKAKGIKSIRFWAVTHTDTDHISGLTEILEQGYPVENLIIAKAAPKDEALEALCRLAKEKGSNLLYVRPGDILHLGEARMEFAAPETGRVWTDKNAASLVFYYEEQGFCGLFTGDIGEAEEDGLLSEGKIRGVNFYKAAHHGSGGSNSEAFLQALSPEIAVVSCAKDNSYGHPAKTAVGHMTAAGSEVFYTMEGGRIRVTMKNGQMAVEKYLQPLDVFRCSVLQ